MLSQVERGLLDPSLDTLRNIADALGTAPFRLLAEEGAVAGIVRRGEGRIVDGDDGGSRIELLSPSLEGAFEIARVGAGARALAARRSARPPRRGGEPLLQGRAVLEIGDERIELAAGDCITFDPRRPHRVTAIGDETVSASTCLPAVVLTRRPRAEPLRWPSLGGDLRSAQGRSCDHVCFLAYFSGCAADDRSTSPA